MYEYGTTGAINIKARNCKYNDNNKVINNISLTNIKVQYIKIIRVGTCKKV